MPYHLLCCITVALVRSQTCNLVFGIGISYNIVQGHFRNPAQLYSTGHKMHMNDKKKIKHEVNVTETSVTQG